MVLFQSIFLIALAFVILKVYKRLTCGICKSSKHLCGKVVIVTGANTGIGYETAKNMAERGAKVILACRNSILGEAACKSIIDSTGNKNVHYQHLDLSSLKSVREFARITLEHEKQLDVLVNNAGVYRLGKKTTADGLLVGMQTNHFGPFLLTNLLLPLLKSSAPSRIVNVASHAYKQAAFDVEDINMMRIPEDKYSSLRDYGNSKLANILMTVELSKRLKGTAVTTNALHPGLIKTEISRHLGPIFNFIIDITLGLIAKSLWEGAQTTIYLAVSPEVENVSGKYFSNCKEYKLSDEIINSDLARKLWEKSEEFVKLK